MIAATIPVSYGAGQTYVGLTICKVLEARCLLYAAGADMKNLSLVVGPRQELDLFRQVRVAETEFHNPPEIKRGHISQFLGFAVEIGKNDELKYHDSVRDCFAICGDHTVKIECADKDLNNG